LRRSKYRKVGNRKSACTVAQKQLIAGKSLHALQAPVSPMKCARR
jgi:hypothetical protein